MPGASPLKFVEAAGSHVGPLGFAGLRFGIGGGSALTFAENIATTITTTAHTTLQREGRDRRAPPGGCLRVALADAARSPASAGMSLPVAARDRRYLTADIPWPPSHS